MTQAPGLLAEPRAVNGKIEKQGLTGARLFVGCPMYDGRCSSQFTFALCQLSALCTQLGLPLELSFAAGEALVMKARNAIADRFLRSDATHLMLIDADIGFNAADVIDVLRLQNGDGQANAYDVLTAPYPLKHLAWDKVAQAARLGLAQGDAADLQYFASGLLLCPEQAGSFAFSRPLEVTQAGTGFMMIPRKTLEAFQRHYPRRRYKSASTGMEQDLSSVLWQFFDTAIAGQDDALEEDLGRFLAENPAAGHAEIREFCAARAREIGEYVSEDFMFCRLVRQIGLKVWACPWITLTHVGHYEFRSRLTEIAKLGAV